MNRTEAKTLDRQVRNLFDDAEANLIDLSGKLREARESGVFSLLGYPSYEAWLMNVSSGYAIMGKVASILMYEMAEFGVSQRVIAERTGVSKDTVNRRIAKERQNRLSQNETTDLPTDRPKGGRTYGDVPEPVRLNQDSDGTIVIAGTERAEPRSKFWACTPDDWPSAYKDAQREVSALLRNPTLEQVEELEAFLRRTLIKLDRLKQRIESNIAS